MLDASIQAEEDCCDDEGNCNDEGESGDSQDEEDKEEDEDEEAIEKEMQEARDKFKSDRAQGLDKKEKGPLKNLLRSKGSIWLSNRPQYFFEWSQASCQ